MSEIKRDSFAAIAAARLAGFISYREAIEKLAAATGEVFSAVAVGLRAEGLGEQSSACLVGVERVVKNCGNSLAIDSLLDATMRDGSIEDARVTIGFDDEQIDPDTFGWMRAPFINALRAANLPCPDSLGEPPPYKERTTPAPPWTKPFFSRRCVLLRDGARIMAEVDPAAVYNMAPALIAKIAQWDAALCDAIRAGEIALAQGVPNEELTDDTLLLHASIRTWCERWGHTWPIPDMEPRPVSDAEMRQHLSDAKVEIEELRVERDSLKASANQAAGPVAPSPQSERMERTDLHIIGCLVRLSVPTGTSGTAPYASQTALIDALVQTFPGVAGITKRTLQDRFAKANGSLEQI